MKKREAVSRIMSKDVHSVHRHQNLLEVRELMEKHGVRHVPVVEAGNVVGMISRTDMMRASYGVTRTEEEQNKQGLINLKAEDVMSPGPVSVTPDTEIREVAEVLSELDFSALPVVENGSLVGIVTTTDLIRFLVEMY